MAQQQQQGWYQPGFGHLLSWTGAALHLAAAGEQEAVHEGTYSLT